MSVLYSGRNGSERWLIMYNNDGKFIICGNTQYPANILDKLFSNDTLEIYTIHNRFIPKQNNFILLSKDQELIKTCNSHYPDVTIVYADASDDDILINNGIKTAKAIVISYDDDRENLLITLSTRQLNPFIKIIVTCSMFETMRPKLLRAGANSVISPSTISGNKLASQLVRPTTTEFLESFLQRDDNHFCAQEIFISHADKNSGVTIEHSEYARMNLLILAISRDDIEEITYNPPNDYILKDGDILLVLGIQENFQKLSPYTQYHLKDLDMDTSN